MRYDIAIIGTGPAGVSAAITAKIRNKNIILFGRKSLSEKLEKAEKILNYTGLPEVSGRELADNIKKQLGGLGIEITEKKVSAVYSMGNYFAVQADGEMFEASACILASGVTNDADIPGEDKYLGRGVSYCATCDGRFYEGKDAAVIGYNDEALEDTEYLAELCRSVIFIPAGKLANKKDIASDFTSERITVKHERPLEITGDKKADTLKTDKAEYKLDGIFVIRDASAPDKLVPGLKTDGKHVCVDLKMASNIDGLFVCGDAAGEPYQYIKSAGQGNIAAISAVKYIDSKKHKS